MSDNLNKIAKVVHEANKAWCEANGDNSQVEWSNAPQWAVDATIASINAIKANPDLTASDLHIDWVAQKINSGWRYGTKKDPVKQTHPMLLPFDELDLMDQKKDKLVIAVIKSLI